jgi:hypothetical protein
LGISGNKYAAIATHKRTVKKNVIRLNLEPLSSFSEIDKHRKISKKAQVMKMMQKSVFA